MDDGKDALSGKLGEDESRMVLRWTCDRPCLKALDEIQVLTMRFTMEAIRFRATSMTELW